jgi:hypothetical protein
MTGKARDQYVISTLEELFSENAILARIIGIPVQQNDGMFGFLPVREEACAAQRINFVCIERLQCGDT